MQHTIIQTFDRDELSKKIEEAIEEGWELHGNLVFAAYYADNEHVTIYAQALTNEQDPVEQEFVKPTEADVNALTDFLNRPIDELTEPEKKNRAKMVELIELAEGRILGERNQDPES